jgi:hypothetical protein
VFVTFLGHVGGLNCFSWYAVKGEERASWSKSCTGVSARDDFAFAQYVLEFFDFIGLSSSPFSVYLVVPLDRKRIIIVRSQNRGCGFSDSRK